MIATKLIKITGIRDSAGCRLFIDGVPIHHVVRHSPSGMEWGYAGSGPADAALSILHAIYPPEFADQYYRDFKETFVTSWPQDKARIDVEVDFETWERSLEGGGK